MAPKQIFEEVIKDMTYFAATGGGVTLSGGEPLAQPLGQLLELLKLYLVQEFF